MSISSVFQIVQLVIPAIQTAEEFIRGRGRGGEKREAVLATLLTTVAKFKKEATETAGIDLKSFNWVRFALASPVFLQKVGVLVDAIVDLANFIQTFDDKPDDVPVLVN